MKFNIIPVFFNVGVDQQAELGERFGRNGPQEKNNSDNFKILVEYVRKFKQKNYFNHIRKTANNDEALIDDLMHILKREVSSRKNKNTDILNLSSIICQKLSGLRFTSCSDGLARSSLSVSLEQARLLAREYELPSSDFQSTLDAIRSEGVQREKCVKNSGCRNYNLTTIQVNHLPRQYRPPLGSFGSQYKAI